MKRWTKEEVSALCASVAENGYSKGIRAFMSSSSNVYGRTFASCEYMISKQAKQNTAEDASDAVMPIDAPVRSHTTTVFIPKKKKESAFRRFIKWLFGM